MRARCVNRRCGTALIQECGDGRWFCSACRWAAYVGLVAAAVVGGFGVLFVRLVYG